MPAKKKRHATTTNDRSTGGSFLRGLISGAVFCIAVLSMVYMFMHIRTEKGLPEGIAPLTDLLNPSSSSSSSASLSSSPASTVAPLSELLSLDTPSPSSPVTTVQTIVARPLKQRQIGDGMVPSVITTTTTTATETAESNPDSSSRLMDSGGSSSSSSSSGSSHLRTSTISSSSGSSGTSSNSNSISRSSSSLTDLLKLNISSLLPHYTQRLKDKTQCRALFGKRGFAPPSQRRKPPMLYTFPGSGNTWGRLLIEYATGIYSGSVYNDQSLLKALPGEFTCNWQVSVIKVHPHTHPFNPDLRRGPFHSDGPDKCRTGGIPFFERAVLLIRDPFDSIWSEFQRRVTKSHVEGIYKATFDWHRWQANAAQMSNEYNKMWVNHYNSIVASYKPRDVLFVRYEDLRNEATRVETMRTVTDFLKVPDRSKEQLHCAFILADDRQAHRQIDKDRMVTKELAYTKPLVCRMWALFGQHAAKHNYHPFNNFDCSSFSQKDAIPHINVGPQGEYDKKWLSAKLLNFGAVPANWDQQVRQARVALQTEVLAELGDHLTTPSITSRGNSNSGNGGSSNSNSIAVIGEGNGQDQDQGQSRDLSSAGRDPPLGLAHGKGLMKSFSSSEQASARRRAGIGRRKQRKGPSLNPPRKG